MKKGISPLVATVILIAATMSIAGILAYWTTGFIRTRLTEAEGITGGTKCFGAELELRSGSYDSNTLHLILDNKKSVDLMLTNLFLLYPDNKLETKSLNETIKGNEIKALNIENVVPEFLTGEIKTQCPDVSIFFTYSKVAG